MARILITDGETRTCLAATRALGRAGHQVYVTSGRVPALATVSRFCTDRAQVPPAREAPDATAEALSALVDRWAIDVLLPVTDVSSLLVLRTYGARVGRAVVAGPDAKAFESMSDKAKLLDFALAAGVRTPKSVVAERQDHLRAAAEAVGYPCVLKPHRSIVLSGGIARGFGVRHVTTRADLDAPIGEAGFPVVVQEHVRGVGEGLFLLVDRDRLLAAFAHRRLREKPPEGGVSTYREAIPLDSELVARCVRMLAQVGWRGAAMVEFRRTPEGEAVLMEVNGRLWGSLQLAIDAGVDFAGLLVAMFLGETVRPSTGYRVGVRTRWEWGDVDHLLARIKSLRSGTPSHLRLPRLPRLLLDFATGFARAEDRLEILRADDIRPFFRETLDWFRGRGS